MRFPDIACLTAIYTQMVAVDRLKYYTGGGLLSKYLLVPTISCRLRYTNSTVHPACRLQASVACLEISVSIIPEFSNI